MVAKREKCGAGTTAYYVVAHLLSRKIIREAADLFFDKLYYVAINSPADVLIRAMPMSLLERMDQDEVAQTSKDDGDDSENEL